MVRDVSQKFSDPFEPGLEPTVDIAEVDSLSGTSGATVGRWPASSSDGAVPDTADEFYVVEWQTAESDLDPERDYRLSVSVRDEELGTMLLHVERPLEEPFGDQNDAPGRVRRGAPFPIKFRIERRAVDRDADGVVDWEDNCPDIHNPRNGSGSQTDTDEDGVGDACECSEVRCEALDPCHSAGVCVPETGRCTAAALPDTDGDGACDAVDACPSDGEKQTPGVCGCGLSEVDTDADGTPDCDDPCPMDPTRASSGPCGRGPSYVDLTWMTIANVYLEMGSVRALLDGYVTRIPQSNFYGGGGGVQNTHSASVPDVAGVSEVLAALGGEGSIDLLLTGHSHFDHSFDTATWSALTNAAILGSKTTCFQVVAQGIPAERCREVLGGETITLAEGVTLRVIRWNHSGDHTKNPEQHDAVELDAVPIPDPATGGLRAGVSEDFPNGGGGRAFLFTVDGPEGPYSFLFMDSGGATDLDVPIVVGGVDYGAPISNLETALADAGLTSVDLLVAPSANGGELAKSVVPIAHPKAYIPVHWDNYFAPFLSQPASFRDSAFTSYLAQQNVPLFVPVQVMDKWRLGRHGVEAIENAQVKAALALQ